MRIGWPVGVAVGLHALLLWLLSTSTGHDCFMHSFDAPAHRVSSCGVEVVEWTRPRTICTGVEVVDVTSVGVTVIHVHEALDRIWWCHLGGRRPSWEMLCIVALVPSTSTSAISAASATTSSLIVIVVVVALLVWCCVHWWRISGWLCHDGVTHLLQVGELSLQLVDCVRLVADSFLGGCVGAAEGRDGVFEH